MRDGSAVACAQRGKDFFAETQVVCRGLAAVLEKWVRRMCGGEGELVLVREVDVVEGEGDDGERVWCRAEGVLEG